MSRAAQISYSAIHIDGDPSTTARLAHRLKDRADLLQRFVEARSSEEPDDDETEDDPGAMIVSLGEPQTT